MAAGVAKSAASGSGRKRGQPTKYRAEFAEQAYRFCLLGADDARLAELFGVHQRTVDSWKKAHAEFRQSITRGKDVADAEIAHALYHRAKGYSHAAVKIFQHNGEPVIVPYTEHYPPDTQAASLWLRNRQPKQWRDKVLDLGEGVDALAIVIKGA